MGRKNVGIMTFHHADNLGAVLQAYALQTTIEKNIGASAEIIDYQCNAIESTVRVKNCKTIKDFAKYIPMKMYYYIKHRGFEKFRKEKLVLSQERYNSDNIKDCANNYDVFITGSDQVWNFECSGNDVAYFLDFVSPDKKRISYAASIGRCKYDEKQAKTVYSALEKFDSISVREESAAKQLESIGVNGAVVLPDPVILLSTEEWQGIMKKRLCRQKYVLVYMVVEDVNVTKSAKEYARIHNCKVISNKESIEFILHNSPAEFLSWIYYAECVFTNSFHGTAFSTIFNKPLCADIELKNGGANGRVKEFLNRVNAEQCILNKYNLRVNTPDAMESLPEMQKSAIEYLKNNCQ